MLRYHDPIPDRPRRVVVAGVSGSGKTTLARRIAAAIDAPHTEIDALFHGTGWVPRPRFERDVAALVARETWTTELQYASVRPLLLGRADLVVWLDLPFWRVTLPRLVRRTVMRRWRRTELWNGNVEPPLWTILTEPEHVVRWAVSHRHKYRNRLPALTATWPHLSVVRLRSPHEVEAWVAGPLRRAAADPRR